MCVWCVRARGNGLQEIEGACKAKLARNWTSHPVAITTPGRFTQNQINDLLIQEKEEIGIA